MLYSLKQEAPASIGGSTFTQIINRQNTNCIKYDFAAEMGYPEGIRPFWVADMDFQAPAQVIEELVRRSAHGIFGYTAPKQDYYDTLADWFQKHHGWQKSAWPMTC